MTNYLVITGGSRGIGESTIQVFLREGWSVINLSRSSCEIAKVINITADFSTMNWAENIQEPLLNILKKPHKIALVHNASAHGKNDVQTLSAIELREAFEVNIVAPVQLNQIVLKKMSEGSSIIYLGSTLSEKAVKNAASYVISKHAVVGLMRSTCQDLVDLPIHTACICPGFTDTAMLRDHLNQDKKVLQAIKHKVGANRLIQPTEIAELVWFCANNPVINGSVIHANLGQIES